MLTAIWIGAAIWAHKNKHDTDPFIAVAMLATAGELAIFVGWMFK